MLKKASEEEEEEVLRRLELREGTFMLGIGGGMLGLGSRGALPAGGSGLVLATTPVPGLRREGEGLRLPLGDALGLFRSLCSSSWGTGHALNASNQEKMVTVFFYSTETISYITTWLDSEIPTNHQLGGISSQVK